MNKLQQGDYVTDLTEEQFRELERIESTDHKMPYFGDGDDLIRYDRKENMLFCNRVYLGNRLTFDEFRERAINTFQP